MIKQQNESKFESVKETASNDTLISDDLGSSVFYATLQVDDFDTWLQNFNSSERNKLLRDFENTIIHQGLDDENLVMITRNTSDHQITKDYFLNLSYTVSTLDLQ